MRFQTHRLMQMRRIRQRKTHLHTFTYIHLRLCDLGHFRNSDDYNRLQISIYSPYIEITVPLSNCERKFQYLFVYSTCEKQSNKAARDTSKHDQIDDIIVKLMVQKAKVYGKCA